MQGNTIINVGKTQWIAGLIWQPLTGSNSADRLREVKQLTTEMSLEMYIIASRNNAVGMAKKGDLKGAVFSVSAAVSDVLTQEGVNDFILIDQLEDGRWYYLAHREGMILPDGDNVFDSEDEARIKFFEDYSLGSLEKAFVPEMWGMDNTDTRKLSSLLPELFNAKAKPKREWRMSDVNPYSTIGKYKLHLIGLMVVAIATGGGAMYYKKVKDDRHKKELERLQALAGIKNEPQVLPHPWKTQFRAITIASNCMDAIDGVVLFPGNWKLDSVTCNASNATVSWIAGSYGYIDQLKAVMPKALVSVDGKTASVSIPFEINQKFDDEETPNLNERLSEMYSKSQLYNISFKGQQTQAPVTGLPGQGQANQPVVKDWGEVSWQITESLLPIDALKILEGNGFRLTQMQGKWVKGKLTWNMEGMQYVKP